MVVGVLRLTLSIPGARSLKDKRQVVRKIVDRVRARYNVSIAEVGENDSWQRALLGVTVVANDHSFVNQVLDKLVRDVEGSGLILLSARELEIETYSEMHGNIADKPLLDELGAKGGSALMAGAEDDWDLEAEERALRAAEENEPVHEAHPGARPGGGRPGAPHGGSGHDVRARAAQDCPDDDSEPPGWLTEEDFK